MHYLKLRNKNDNFIWPSFVDALASLLIVIIFILMIFVISQYYISQKLSGKDQAYPIRNKNFRDNKSIKY